MPIGSSKLGVLGAGLVPGGSVTFNASGTWAVPPGVKKVSITGRGGRATQETLAIKEIPEIQVQVGVGALLVPVKLVAKVYQAQVTEGQH
jgi:hypothetical protein